MPRKAPSSKVSQEQSVDVIFGQIVREKRLALGLRLIDLQSEGGLDRSHIGKIEAGKVQVCLRGLIQIAQGLEMTPGALVDDVMKKMP